MVKRTLLFFSLLSLLFSASLSFVERHEARNETAISAYLDDPGY
ncbi:hypothetical protein SAM19_04950 [Brevibacillus laterosporus]|nr:hypothetical protein [Brevibacillus laterosporus]